jgi:serine/threonine-protein kinase
VATPHSELSSSESERAGPSSDPAALVGTVLAERYKIEALLGQGGMGTVYRAEHIHMRRLVALKVLHPEIAALEEFAARFEREAVAAGRIEHRNVAKATDFGRLDDGSFYLVIEYVKGASLRELLRKGPLAPATALEIARQIAEALHAAHQAGVVHRDLKPDNVMIAERDTHGCWVKVLDFGVAKLAIDEASGGSPITRFGAIIGTPEYMSPEQAGGGAVDHRADLYALGVILYEMLGGQPPFSGDDRVVVLSKHFVEPPPPLPASVPEKASAIALALLEKEVDARIQSAAEVIERIAEARSELGPAAVTSPLEPPAVADMMLAETASSAMPARRRLPRAVVFAAVAGVAGLSLFWIFARDKQDESATTLGVSAAEATAAPVASASAAAPARPEPAETSEAPAPAATAEANTEPEPSAEQPAAPEPSPVETRKTTTPRKIVVRPGQRVIIRRTIRRTYVTR